MKKNKYGNLTIVIVAISVTVILAVILTSISWENVNDRTTTQAVTADTFTAVNGSCVRITDDCYLSNTLVVKNATNNLVITGNFTPCGENNDYYGAWLKPTGGQKYLNGAGVNASYTKISCDYITGGTAMIIRYTPILMAVAILAYVGIAIGMR